MTENSDLVLDNKNRKSIRCQYCFSLILKPVIGDYIEIEEKQLPLVHQKHSKDVHTIATDTHSKFWTVNDMFTFENIGVSNTVESRKYLTCADCDMGPIGYLDIPSQTSYIALNRVRYGDEPEKIVEVNN